MLSDRQIRHFKEEGYLALHGFFNDRETRALQNAFEELLGAGVLNNVATDRDGATKVAHRQNLQVCPLSYHHRLFAALPFHPGVREALTQLIDGDVYKMLDQIFYKPAGTGVGTNWHQDNYYFRMPDPFSGTALWIALHDATVENGTIRIIPRALDTILEHGRDPESDHHSRCWPDEGRAIPVEMKAGSALFFCFNTPHATGPNRTERGRAGLAYHFLKLSLAYEHPETLKIIQQGHQLYGEAGREHGPILNGSRYTAGRAEYGCDMERELVRECERLAGAAAGQG